MGLSFQTKNYASQFNSLYQITLDMSGWDKTTVQFISPMTGSVFIYGSNDGGALFSVREGTAKNAGNFQPIQATQLATGTSVNAASSAGDYKIDINAQYLILRGNPAGAGTAVYGIIFNHYKIG